MSGTDIAADWEVNHKDAKDTKNIKGQMGRFAVDRPRAACWFEVMGPGVSKQNQCLEALRRTVFRGIHGLRERL